MKMLMGSQPNIHRLHPARETSRHKAPDNDLSADLLLMIGSSPVCAQVCGSDKTLEVSF